MRDNRERAEFIHQTLASGDISDSSNWGIICNALNEAEARGRAAGLSEAGTIERFHSKVRKTESCWIWKGANIRGYGQIWDGTKLVLAHRWIFERENGPLAPGMQCCHRCDVPQCVNPAHLFAGTNNDNIKDSMEKGRRLLADEKRVKACKRGHELSGLNLIQKGRDRRCRTCENELKRARRKAKKLTTLGNHPAKE